MSQIDLSRTEMIIGSDALEKLRASHVAVFGIGGVGGHLCEALCRAGIGELTIIDGDTVSTSNVNRQIIALQSTVGMEKTEVMKARLLDINPELRIHSLQKFLEPEDVSALPFDTFTCIADCIDSVKTKIEIICRASDCGIPIISSMGAGNKLHPENFRISDIYKTEQDPLAKVLRHELRLRGVKKLPVVFSDEIPAVRTVPPGSMSFVPSAAGLIAAG